VSWKNKYRGGYDYAFRRKLFGSSRSFEELGIEKPIAQIRGRDDLVSFFESRVGHRLHMNVKMSRGKRHFIMKNMGAEGDSVKLLVSSFDLAEQGGRVRGTARDYGEIAVPCEGGLKDLMRASVAKVDPSILENEDEQET